MENKKYAIMSGCYSDWEIHGYMEDKEKAMKYCAIRNKAADGCDEFYVVDLDLIDAEVSDVVLNYYYKILFDLPSNRMRGSGINAEYYIGEDRPSQANCNIYGNNTGWIRFSFNCDSEEKAIKIAQDKFAQFLAYYSENKDYRMSAKLMGCKIK